MGRDLVFSFLQGCDPTPPVTSGQVLSAPPWAAPTPCCSPGLGRAAAWQELLLLERGFSALWPSKGPWWEAAVPGVQPSPVAPLKSIRGSNGTFPPAPWGHTDKGILPPPSCSQRAHGALCVRRSILVVQSWLTCGYLIPLPDCSPGCGGGTNLLESLQERMAGHATCNHHQLFPFPGSPWLLRIGACRSADLRPLEDFVVGSGTFTLLVLSA